MSRKALERYYAILDGDGQASYLRTKRQLADIDLESAEEDLWKAHNNQTIKPGCRRTADGPTSRLDLKVELSRRILKKCNLCERGCGVDRTAGERGHCGVQDARISSEFIHMGEEPDLVPSYTVFFSGCTFNCVFCQNWDISTRPDSGQAIDASDLAHMIERRAMVGTRGATTRNIKNVNWVGGDPTSNLPFVLEVLQECRANVPQVWNSNMYLSVESMDLLNGTVDVYLTDWKYGNDKCALRLSNAPNYTRVMERNHRLGRQHAEMIIRHLVLPGHLDCCTRPALNWIAENLKDVLVNVMAQYRPEHRASEFPDLARPLRMAEYREAVEIAETLGLELTD